jgi:hypothetical protein
MLFNLSFVIPVVAVSLMKRFLLVLVVAILYFGMIKLITFIFHKSTCRILKWIFMDDWTYIQIGQMTGHCTLYVKIGDYVRTFKWAVT